MRAGPRHTIAEGLTGRLALGSPRINHTRELMKHPSAAIFTGEASSFRSPLITSVDYSGPSFDPVFDKYLVQPLAIVWC